VVAEVRMHRTRTWIVVILAWSLLVLAALARGRTVVNGQGIWFVLFVTVVVVGTVFAARTLWRHPYRVMWIAGGSDAEDGSPSGELVLESLAARQVVQLEPPVSVHRYEAAIPQTDADPREVTDVIIRSAAESVGVTSPTKRAAAAVQLGKAVAIGMGAAEPGREAAPAQLHWRYRWDGSLRWLNDGGDFTTGQMWGLGTALVLVAPLTVLAGVLAFGSPGGASLVATADEVEGELDASRSALVDALEGDGVSTVDEPPATAPSAEVASKACSRQGGNDWLWGPADEAYLEVTATVTLEASALAPVTERLAAVGP
jgi:hypothetical protein